MISSRWWAEFVVQCDKLFWWRNQHSNTQEGCKGKRRQKTCVWLRSIVQASSLWWTKFRARSQYWLRWGTEAVAMGVEQQWSDDSDHKKGGEDLNIIVPGILTWVRFIELYKKRWDLSNCIKNVEEKADTKEILNGNSSASRLMLLFHF